jgi:HSP20 family molecular chaperone IbpA
MSGVRESAKAHQTSLQTQTLRQAAELDRVKRLHEKNITATKIAQEDELQGVRESHQMDLAREVQKKEETLKQMRDSLEKTQRMTEQESKRLQISSAQQRELTRERLQDDLMNLNHKHNEASDEINVRQNMTLKELNDASALRLKELQDQNRQAHSNEGEGWRHKINQQRQQFQHTYTTENDKYAKIHNDSRNKHDQTLKVTHRKNQEQISTLNDGHVKHQEKVINHHQKALTDKEAFFEKKYQNQLTQHQKYEQNLLALNEKAVGKAKEEANQRINFSKERDSDPFFTFTELKPQVIHEPNRYIIKIAVPEYAKEEILLSANQKEIVLTANRRYQDERRDEAGVLQKINKVESLVSRIPVEHVLSPRKMTKDYADGVMTFVIQKA